jgi:3-oxoacid CoA-transferase subunit A
MATAARVTIVEVEEIVEPGQLAPDGVHLASVYVKRIVLSTGQQKRIEKHTVRKRA